MQALMTQNIVKTKTKQNVQIATKVYIRRGKEKTVLNIKDKK